MKIARTVFQENPDLEGTHHFRPNSKKVIVLLDLEDQAQITTDRIPNLPSLINQALPGIFPDPDDPLAHLCGGEDTSKEIHSFREEVVQGTTLAHLMEHILLFLLSKRTFHCAGYTGRRSMDIERGIRTHYYIVVEYPSRLEAIIAIDVAFDLIKAWADGTPLRRSGRTTFFRPFRPICKPCSRGEAQEPRHSCSPYAWPTGMSAPLRI